MAERKCKDFDMYVLLDIEGKPCPDTTNGKWSADSRELEGNLCVGAIVTVDNDKESEKYVTPIIGLSATISEIVAYCEVEGSGDNCDGCTMGLRCTKVPRDPGPPESPHC
jgi:hypothetical protein